MATFAWQTWNSAPFNIERKRGKTPGTVIFHLSGPLTVRDVYSALSPVELNKVLDLPAEPGEEPPVKYILDLTDCPFIDSSGLGMVATHYVRCQRHGIKMIAVGASPRVREVLRITKMDSILPMVATLEEAENA
jgi:anti-sigma B factor antagonist